MVVKSIRAEGFRRLLTLVLQCWSIELFQLFLKQNRTGCMLSISISLLTMLHWDRIIQLRCCPHSLNGPVSSCGIESEML